MKIFLLFIFLPSHTKAVGREEIFMSKLELERGWLGRVNFVYSGLLRESLKQRHLMPNLTLGYIFNRNFSLIGGVSGKCFYKQNEGRKEKLLLFENIK